MGSTGKNHEIISEQTKLKIISFVFLFLLMRFLYFFLVLWSNLFVQNQLTILLELSPKSRVGVDHPSSLFDMFHSVRVEHVMPVHQIGDHEAGTSGHSCSTVDEHISALWQLLLDPVAVGIEVVVDLLIIEISDVVLYVLHVLELSLHFFVLEWSQQIAPACADCSNLIFLNGFFITRSILIAQIQPIDNHLNLRVQFGSALFMRYQYFGLLGEAFFANFPTGPKRGPKLITFCLYLAALHAISLLFWFNILRWSCVHIFWWLFAIDRSTD